MCICPCDHHCHQGSVYLHHSGQLPRPCQVKPAPHEQSLLLHPVDQPRLLVNGIARCCVWPAVLSTMSLGSSPVAVGGSLPLPFYDWVELHRWPPVETVTDPCESPWSGRQPLDQESCEVTSLWVWAPTLTASHHAKKGAGCSKAPSGSFLGLMMTLRMLHGLVLCPASY